MNQPAVELRNITKRFGSIAACDGVNLTLKPGKIHGILGENGAGKSTLMNVLIGLVPPDSGSIHINGEVQTISNPQIAAALGIGMVHQHFSLVDALSVWENVALGEGGRLDQDATTARIREVCSRYGLEVDPMARVRDLSAGLRQRVEIVKCLQRDPSVVIFDEPTSVLTPEESMVLFDSFRDVVAAEGRTVVLVSHKLDEVLAATDQVTIMRHGKVIDSKPTADVDAPGLAQLMVGRDVALRSLTARRTRDSVDPDGSDVMGETVLSLRNATARVRGVTVLDKLSLDLRAGEILGVAGVEGNGQRELGDVLSSLVPLSGGEVVVDGEAVAANTPGAMSSAGVGVIPEDRHDSGVVLDMTVAENLVLMNPQGVANAGVLDVTQMTTLAESMISEFEIQCDGATAPMWSLSGGNQQRVVLARELSAKPKVLVAAQPTRGLDVGAIEYTSARLRSAAAEGVGVLLISSDLQEILDLADRIVVMYRGRIVGEVAAAGADPAQLSLMMGGVSS